MLSPLPPSYGSSNSRRARYSRSPSDSVPPSKRAKPSSSTDPHDRDYMSGTDQHHKYTSICVKHINPKISDIRVRELCDKKFSKYGAHSVKIYRKSNERVAFVNFTNAEDARKAGQAKTDLVWEGMKVFLDPVFYRKTGTVDQPISSGNLHERFQSSRRARRPSPRRSPSPVVPSRNHSHRQTSSRRQRLASPPPSPPPPPPPLSRSSRRPYSPYIPLPPDLVDYNGKKSSRQRQRLSPSPVRRHHHKQTSRQQRSKSPNNHRSISSPSHRVNIDNEPIVQHEPSRTLFIENLERNITESILKQIFSRYGIIEEIDIKKSLSTSKRSSAIIKFENMEMAYGARQAMDGQFIGETVSKIGYGKTAPTRHLWIGNITRNINRRDLEYTFSRYGQIEKIIHSVGSVTAIVSYIDIEDAIKARTKLNGAVQVPGRQVIFKQSDLSTSSRDGLHIDYHNRSTIGRRVINQGQQNSLNRRESKSLSSSHSRKNASASSTSDRARSASRNDETIEQSEDNITENLKTETHSRSPTPPILNTIKQRRSTDHSPTPTPPPANSSPVAGRTFHSPLGSYISLNDTANINNINDLMILCEQLNSSATKSNTALSTVYPVQFILKSHAYDARMHFLAGSPTLASILLGQPGDLVAAKTELKITQRLRLEQHKLDDLERKLRANVTIALNISGNNSHTNLNSHSANSLTSSSNRKQLIIPNQTKFSILIASPKIYHSNESSNSKEQRTIINQVKNEKASPPPSNDNDEHIKVKEETMDDHESINEEEPLLSRLISYLTEKEAAGVISIPFHPTYQNDYNHSSKQETAVLHIFPPCQFTKKILKIICPSIHFSNDSQTPSLHSTEITKDEHLMVVIIHSE